MNHSRDGSPGRPRHNPAENALIANMRATTYPMMNSLAAMRHYARQLAVTQACNRSLRAYGAYQRCTTGTKAVAAAAPIQHWTLTGSQI